MPDLKDIIIILLFIIVVLYICLYRAIAAEFQIRLSNGEKWGPSIDVWIHVETKYKEMGFSQSLLTTQIQVDCDLLLDSVVATSEMKRN